VDERDRDEIRGRLVARFGSLPRSAIEDALRASFARYDGARVRHFVPLLAERAARERLQLALAHES
jgi:hypothetical protein